MNLTIEISWWIIPAIVTIAAFIWAGAVCRSGSSGGSYSGIGDALMALIFFGAASIISLVAWLAWAVLS